MAPTPIQFQFGVISNKMFGSVQSLDQLGHREDMRDCRFDETYYNLFLWQCCSYITKVCNPLNEISATTPIDKQLTTDHKQLKSVYLWAHPVTVCWTGVSHVLNCRMWNRLQVLCWLMYTGFRVPNAQGLAQTLALPQYWPWRVTFFWLNWHILDFWVSDDINTETFRGTDKWQDCVIKTEM